MKDHLLGVASPKFLGCRKHGIGSPLNMHIIGRLDQALVDTKSFMIEMQDRNTVADKRVREFVLAPCRDLQGDIRCLGVFAGREAAVHSPRKIPDHGIRVVLLGVGYADLVLVFG